MDLIRKLSGELKVQEWRVKAAVDLIDEGNTIPFIARYRKEATGELNDEQLRTLDERLRYLRNLLERKEAVLSGIEEQGKLTEELRAAIDKAETLVAVEDIYRPYKPKRRTRASIAKERGLEPLSELILKQELEKPAILAAEDFICEEKGVSSAKEALNGAMDIIAEAVSDEAGYRTYIRNVTMEEGILSSTVKDSSLKSVYEMYYDFEEPVGKLAGHRILAINRGEAEKILTVKINAPEERIFKYLEKKIITSDNEYTATVLREIIKGSYERLIAPAIEREIRNALTEKAEDGAIEVFGKNLKQLLMQPPIAGQVVLGWDPAFRTGCKLAVVDETGKVLDTAVIYPTAPQNKIEESKQTLKALIRKYGITVISVGNGTASRESERIIVDLLKEIKSDVRYVIVNEAGASVYSASRLATEEFPEFDVGQRSAASIARRLQDPLAELVKIDPRSIGVGQYQHDMDQKKLSEALTGVVEDSVNKVGVDLNTASASLLEYISGINKTVAKNIVDYRERNGRFDNRRELLKVDKLGPKAYEQCAGFMRITGGSNPLDETSVHPESYEATEKLLKILGLSMADVKKLREEAVSQTAIRKNTGKGLDRTSENQGFIEKRAAGRKGLSKELGIGEITLKDIIKELEKPGRDPRDDMPRPLLKSDIMEMSDLKPGMILKGTVRNVIDFGAFVDIGVHQDGLVHISQIAERYIKHPLDAVSVGDVVDVKVLEVDVEKKRIALTMKL